MPKRDPEITAPEPLDTRERILRTATDEFASRGLAGARVDRIARDAGVNKAMIYYHFSSKEELYRETIADMYRKVASNISSFLDFEDSLEEALRKFADYFTNMMIDHPAFRSVLMRELAWPSPEIIDMISGIMTSAGLPRSLLDRLESEMDAGRIRRADPRQLVISFLTMNIGYFLLEPLLQRLMEIDDRVEFLETRKKEVLRIFLEGIRKK